MILYDEDAALRASSSILDADELMSSNDISWLANYSLTYSNMPDRIFEPAIF